MTELDLLKIAHEVADQCGLTVGRSVRPIIDALKQAIATEREACAKLADDKGECIRILKGRCHPERAIALAIRSRTPGWKPELGEG